MPRPGHSTGTGVSSAWSFSAPSEAYLSVPVGVGQPTLRIDALTVGGTGG